MIRLLMGPLACFGALALILSAIALRVALAVRKAW